jgi:hypothetical protein
LFPVEICENKRGLQTAYLSLSKTVVERVIDANVNCQLRANVPNRYPGMNRSVTVFALLISSLFLMLNGQVGVVAVPVSSTTTQTATTYLTVTGTGATVLYQTFTQVTSFPTMTGTTYTTTGVVGVPVQVLTTVASPVTSTIYGEGVGCDPSGHCVTSYTTQTILRYVTQTGYVIVMSPSQVQGSVTSQYSTNLPTTVFSTSASTSSYVTGQVAAITNTQTFTYVTESTPPAPSMSEMLTQNLWAVLVLSAAVLAVPGFRLGRRGGRGGRGPSRVSAPDVFCMSCGFRLTQDSQFCPKCGARRTDT